MKKNWIIFIIIAHLSTALWANEEDTVRAISLENPYQTVYTHLNNLQNHNFHPDLSAKAFEQAGVSQYEARDAAVKLKHVLDGEGIYIEMDEIPKDPNYLDSATNRNRYVLTSQHPEIFLVKKGNKWVYSKTSIVHIDQVFSKVFPFGTDKLLDILPKMGSSKYLGLYIWQILGILILILLSFIVHKLFTLIIEKIIISLLVKGGYKKLATNLVKPVAKPISYLIIFPILMVMVPVLQLPVTFSKYLITALKALWPVFLTVVAYRLVDIFGIYMMKVAEKTESTLDDQLVPLLRKVLKTFVIIIGALFVLINLNISIIPFITGISIGGLALALAAQDTIKNFFGSLMIFIDKPFQIGNWITSGEIDGEVEEVGLRSTRVRTFRNSLVYVPNGVLADRTIDNHGLRVYRRYYTTLAITYDTPARLIEVFIEGLNKIVKNHPHTRKDKFHIFMNDFGDSSLNIMFYIFFQAPNWALELQYRHEIIIQILRLAEDLNVRFAFPTRTLHMETFPDKSSLTPLYSENRKGMQKQMDHFFKEEDEE